MKKTSKLADKIEKKYKIAQTVEQADIGVGEPKAVAAVAGNKIQNILTSQNLVGKALHIQFVASVNVAPNFAAKSVDLTSVEVYAGYDDPEKTKAETASEQIMSMKPAIEAALVKFYKTPEGVSVLKSSGSPPTIKVVFKWKLK